MITTILSDFSRVILFPKNREFPGKLNDLYEELTSTLGSYDFFSYFDLNTELLETFRNLKDRYSINILTTGAIQDAPEVRAVIDPIFNQILSAKNFSLKKNEQQLYVEVAEILGKPTSEIIFIDDTAANLQAAKNAGMTVFHYHNNETLMKEMAPFVKDH